MGPRTFSDVLVDELVELGFTHCFFLAGGNIMHLLSSCSSRFKCIPFAHEHSAVIAAEYFNQINREDPGRAFALVTAGPGLTNAITAIAGAWLEKRSVLVLGGQVKTSDLSRGSVRQRGIQELDGVKLVESITTHSVRLEAPISKTEIQRLLTHHDSKEIGPTFLEIPLDVQAAPPLQDISAPVVRSKETIATRDYTVSKRLRALIEGSVRPILLLGGGVSRKFVKDVYPKQETLGIPVMTTYNGADLGGPDLSLYAGRPNTWGQRSSNLLIQQADLVVAIGTRLGLQQTGFNWEQFAPCARVVQIDIDRRELEKGHPKLELGIEGDGDLYLADILETAVPKSKWSTWVTYVKKVRAALPLAEPSNHHAHGFVDPYKFIAQLSTYFGSRDVLIPCSSGGAFTATMQCIEPIANQRVITNKSLASMGYGLAGAIGACLAASERTILFEGDGGFLQNIQELVTVKKLNLPLKMFLFSNDGYASIRMTQRNYFGGNFLGSNSESGLHMPSWEMLSTAFGIKFVRLAAEWPSGSSFSVDFDSPEPVLFEVAIDPNQTYYPKIGSTIRPDGSMSSNPLHLMDPPLESELMSDLTTYLQGRVD